MRKATKKRAKSCSVCALSLRGNCSGVSVCDDFKPPKASCGRCSTYLVCPNPRKSEGYVCSLYKRNKSYISSSSPNLSEAVPLTNTDYDTQEEFDLQRMVMEATASTELVPPDLSVPDGDLPRAKNFLEFCCDPQFLNITPFPKQLEIGIHLFSEWCPDCNTDYVHDIPFNEPLDLLKRKVVLFENNVCPICSKTKAAFVKEGKLTHYHELAGLAGQRGGKSAFVAMAGSYHTHLLLKSQNPQMLYGLLSNSVLHGTVIALTFAQAKASLWDPFNGYLTESPWFIAYNALLDDIGQREGVELVKLKDTFIHYKHRNMILSPSGPNMKTLRGYTRFLAALDELGWFNTGNEKLVKINANEVHHAVGRSLLTVRSASRKRMDEGYSVPNGTMYNVSSPSNARDKIVTLYKNSLKPNSKIYGFWYTTFELNPSITKEDVQEEFDADPIAARRDYLAIAPQATSPFIENFGVVGVNMRKRKNTICTTLKEYTSKSGVVTMYGTIDVSNCDKARPKILAIDAGFSNNSFAIVVASVIGKTLYVDGFIEIIPRAERALNHSLICKHIIVELVKKVNVVMVSADRWQSIKLLQDIEREQGVSTKTYSVKYEDFLSLRRRMHEGDLDIPLAEMSKKELDSYSLERYPQYFDGMPTAHFALQCVTVVDLIKTVDKGDGTTDDLFRALTLAQALVYSEDHKSLFQHNLQSSVQQSTVGLGVAGAFSSGGSIGGSSVGAVAGFRRL